MDNSNLLYQILVIKRGYTKSQIKRLLRRRIRKMDKYDRESRSPNAHKQLKLMQKGIEEVQELLDNWEEVICRRDSALWEQVRQEAFERDKRECICCGKYELLQGHHIKNFADNIEERYDVDNVVTLCEECHKQFHSIYGKRNTSKLQLQSFLELHSKNLF